MELSILPAVALVFVLLFSVPPEAKEPVSRPRVFTETHQSKKITRPRIQEETIEQSHRKVSRPRLEDVKKPKKEGPIDVEHLSDRHDLDYQTIYEYIITKYRRINKEDAELISKSLVEYGRRHRLDPKFAAAVIARESAFKKEAISVTGAKGLGQIKDFNFPSLKINNPYDIKENASGTMQYLKEMLKGWRHKSDKVSLALASYYKGAAAVKKDKGVLDEKTKGYVRDILVHYEKIKELRTNLERRENGDV